MKPLPCKLTVCESASSMDTNGRCESCRAGGPLSKDSADCLYFESSEFKCLGLSAGVPCF
jgi:hypothetical protein